MDRASHGLDTIRCKRSKRNGTTERTMAMKEMLIERDRADRSTPAGWLPRPFARAAASARSACTDSMLDSRAGSDHVVAGADSETRVSGRQSRLLLAEDEVEMRALLVWALRRAGYEVDVATDGLELLVKLDQNSAAVARGEFRRWDLIISDIRMPALGGLEALEGVAGREAFPPIILITAFGDAETHARGKRLGAVAIFDKPFDVDDLLAKVREVALVRNQGPSCP